ncbi:galactokinase [Pontibacter russatus]|uniref:galactokinase n=1 Tax=Pontibacter russatus TaxID=2694929 RepID=UPI00137B2557|nr:galactokinase [Pontibacter russatus]
MLKEIEAKFRELYNQEPVVVRSPGRVNLIGEHTDYNEGFVLPAAINKEMFFAMAPNGTNTFRAYSFNLEERADFDLSQVKPSDMGWANYLLGVVAQLQRAGHNVKGFDVVFGGNVPIGAGLSSSAALECGMAFGLNEIFGFGIEKLTLVKMAQKAEHEYAGVMCGIMDQFASMFGKRDHAIKLDCRSLEYAYYHLAMEDYRIVLCDTQVKHSLASSEYNTRRKECEAGVAILHRYYPEVLSLRGATLDMLAQHQQEFDPVVYRRCTYVVSENNRVEAACADLARGDMKSFGKRMYASHEGLQHDYEVSCPELDFLVEQAKRSDKVLGARMMGGGFGGCTINLVQIDALDTFVQQMEQAYQQRFGITLKTYIAEIVDGSSFAE